MKSKRNWVFYLVLVVVVMFAVFLIRSEYEITHLPPILQIIVLGLQFIVEHLSFTATTVALLIFVLRKTNSAYRDAKQKKLLKTLMIEMDAPAFIDECRFRVEDRARKAKTAPYDTVNLALGYFADGQFQKALVLMQEVQDGRHLADEKLLLILHSHFLTMLLFLNYMDRLEFHREILMELNGRKIFLRFMHVLTEYDLAHEMQNGEYDNAITYYSGVFNDKKSTPYAKAYAMSMVAVAYEGKGDMTARNKALSIVAQNGNRLIFAKLARETLNSSSRTLRERIGELAA